jgi:hypothetical protein
MLAVPTLLMIGAVLFEPRLIMTAVLFGGDGLRFGWYGPMLMLSLWTFLYLAVSVACWLVYRLVAFGK